jgi:23S rRNA pseudouridine1911/1915/1917 synthase
VHRLDKATSGLLVIAKNDLSHKKLARQFRRHSVKRKYIALVKGRVAHNQGKIELPIARDRQNRQKMAVSFLENSKEALTRYNVLKRYKDTTLLELIPHTGRTHQLRVHLKSLGHPILGDTRYGKAFGDGSPQLRGYSAGTRPQMALHAAELGFRHPRTGELVEFKSKVPFLIT